MPTDPGEDRGFNYKLYDGDGMQVETDALLSNGAEYMVVALEVPKSEVLLELDELDDEIEWACRSGREPCYCAKCILRPPGVQRGCGSRR